MTTDRGVHFFVISAVGKENGIGYKNELPWKANLNIDMTFFRFITSSQDWMVTQSAGFCLDNTRDCAAGDLPAVAQNHVIMGRNTYQSMTQKLGPHLFSDRRVHVLSRDPNLSSKFDEDSAIQVWSSFEECLLMINARKASRARAIVIGGSQVYEEALRYDCPAVLLLTKIEFHEDLEFDAFFPAAGLARYREPPTNITQQVLLCLRDWPGTGKITRQSILRNIAANEATHSKANDWIIEEKGYAYKFLIYVK